MNTELYKASQELIKEFDRIDRNVEAFRDTVHIILTFAALIFIVHWMC